ncbi:Sodium/hydrogen exchanger family-domain-containing protein [Chytriomyces cf. hyalinus JEL632]|nr:Sodium/hydrogen exchanger family-domain-containing protein [Chytriomyces cf. hyalinus JEL632]
MSSTTTGTILAGDNPLSISPISLLLAQTVVVIVISRLLTIPLRWMNQPAVMAEILGGIVLGASALSRIPAFKDNLFPPSSLGNLKIVANMGLIFYLFLVGLELDPLSMVKTFRKSAIISIAGIVFPFAIGAGASRVIYDIYGDPNVPFLSFTLFTGVAMSITAFPVLARILTERQLLNTPVGASAISAAAVDDFIAWTLLVLVVALIKNTGNSTEGIGKYFAAVYVFLFIIGYTLILWFIVRPLLVRLVKLAQDREHLNQVLLFIVFLLVLFSAWVTEVVGVHAIFGAFLCGVIMPHDHGFAHKLSSQIEDLVTVVFLPLYFASSGLATNVFLLDDGRAWGFTFLVIFVACAGKLIGCTLSARFCALNWRESLAVGILMNTKGLVEIVVLNIGLNAGVITPKLFAMFVLMAIFTTFMTSPLIAIVYPPKYYTSLVKMGDTDTSSEDQRDIQDSALNSRWFSSFVVYGLRLVKIDSRITTLMKAAEHNSTIKGDYILQVMRTFSGLHGINFYPLLQFTESTQSANAIIEGAKQSMANIVIIPQSVSKDVEPLVAPQSPVGTSAPPLNISAPSSWMGEHASQQTHNVALAVKKELDGVTVVHFIDRGFMPLSENGPSPATTAAPLISSPERTSQQTLSTKEPVKKPSKISRLHSSFSPAPVSLVLLVSGALGSINNLESTLLARHVQSGYIHEFAGGDRDFQLYIVRLRNVDASLGSDLQNDEAYLKQFDKKPKLIELHSNDVAAIAGLCQNSQDLVIVALGAL